MSASAYTIAVLCYVFDTQGRLLLLHRRKPPNRDLYSPIGGKLEQHLGESPSQCAAREILEESGLTVRTDELHLTGVVSERGFGDGHWLMFLYELNRPVELEPAEFDEGRLEWVTREQLDTLDLPQTDRSVIWPQFWAHRGGFFMAHLECDGPRVVSWTLERSERKA